MLNINECWLKDNIGGKYVILKGNNKNILDIAETYKSVFNGAPFYENWTMSDAIDVIEDYFNNKNNISLAKYYNEIIGFMVSSNHIPFEQQQYINCDLDKVRFVEEIGVNEKYRGNGIASELVRYDLLDTLNDDKKILAYRTNMMRYFIPEIGESFQTAMERIQMLDEQCRKNGEKILIPELSINEKDEFVNKYIEVIKKVPELDVSNSNRLFRKIFGELDFSQRDNQYQWQMDPTGENNDRIFPIIDFQKIKIER